MLTGRHLVAARTLAGWPSRSAYAAECGLSLPTCQRVESGAADVRPATLERYGRPLGMSGAAVAVLRGGAAEARLVVLPLAAWAAIDREAAARGCGLEDLLAGFARAGGAT